MHIVFSGKENVYEQIVNEYKRYILLGILKYDDKLPSCRQLAKELGINPNTVVRAYNILEQENYIRIVPKKGVYVIYNHETQPNYDEMKQQITIWKTKISYEQLLNIIQEIYRRDKND